MPCRPRPRHTITYQRDYPTRARAQPYRHAPERTNATSLLSSLLVFPSSALAVPTRRTCLWPKRAIPRHNGTTYQFWTGR